MAVAFASFRRLRRENQKYKYRPSMTIPDLGYSMKWQGNSKRKFTGGRLISNRGKRKYELGREAGEPNVDVTRKKQIMTRGGSSKIRLLRCDIACVADPKTGKSKTAKIETVNDNSANLNYIRRNIITKGAIIKTDLGEARVTSRPGQDGIVNAILVAE
jgi:small subunit ribosomal protein S8e